MLNRDSGRENSRGVVGQFELKHAVLISENPILMNGIFYFIKNNLVGLEIIFSGNWEEYQRSNLGLERSFIILTSSRNNKVEMVSQVAHFAELEVPVLLMHNSDLDESLSALMEFAPCIIVEHDCTLNDLNTALLEIIEKNYKWQSNYIKTFVNSSNMTQYSLSPREKQSLTLYASGLTLNEVAHKLQLSPNSISKFISRGKRKLNKSGAIVNSKTSIYLALKK